MLRCNNILCWWIEFLINCFNFYWSLNDNLMVIVFNNMFFLEYNVIVCSKVGIILLYVEDILVLICCVLYNLKFNIVEIYLID